MEAIEKRYGGNKESKKVQRTLLKHQYENFSGSSSETIDQTFDMLQKLVEDPSTNNHSNSSTNEADNTTYGFSDAHTQSNSTSGDNLCDVVIYNEASSTTISPAVESFMNSSKMLENQEYNKSKSDKGYHHSAPRVNKTMWKQLKYRGESLRAGVANKMTHPHPNRRFVPRAVLTRSGKINTVVRPVNTVGLKTNVNHPRLISNAYKKGSFTGRKECYLFVAGESIDKWNKGHKIQVYNGLDLQKSLNSLIYVQGQTHKQRSTGKKELIDECIAAEGGGARCTERPKECYLGTNDGKDIMWFARTPQQNGVAERRNRTLGGGGPKDSEEDSGMKPLKVDVSGAVMIEEGRMDQAHKIGREKVWTLVNLPNGKRAIGTNYVFRNKKAERGIVVRNKVRLVAQGYAQEEGINYDKVFAHVARIEAIRLFLAYASFMGFIVYQMDVKSAFLYGTIEEEVYVCQPLGFEDLRFPEKVYKVLWDSKSKCLIGFISCTPRFTFVNESTFVFVKNPVFHDLKLSTLKIRHFSSEMLGEKDHSLWYLLISDWCGLKTSIVNEFGVRGFTKMVVVKLMLLGRIWYARQKLVITRSNVSSARQKFIATAEPKLVLLVTPLELYLAGGILGRCVYLSLTTRLSLRSGMIESCAGYHYAASMLDAAKVTDQVHESPMGGVIAQTRRSHHGSDLVISKVKRGQKIGKEAKGKNSRVESLQDWYLQKKECNVETQREDLLNPPQNYSVGDTVNTASIDVSVAGPSNEQKWINDFVPIDSEVVKDSRKGKAEGSRKKTVARKRTGEKLNDENVKRQKIEECYVKEDLRTLFR
ncbi:putative ribonuclease H-like domain-containing protein [Tanacetum coccineum]